MPSESLTGFAELLHHHSLLESNQVLSNLLPYEATTTTTTTLSSLLCMGSRLLDGNYSTKSTSSSIGIETDRQMSVVTVLAYATSVLLLIAFVSFYRYFSRLVKERMDIDTSFRKLSRRSKDPTAIIEESDVKRPPEVPGHWLWGNGKEFHEDAAAFLSKMAQETGEDLITLRLAVRRILVLTDIHSYPALVREGRFDFTPIINQVNRNVFGFKFLDLEQGKKRLTKHFRSDKMLELVQRFDEMLAKSLDDFVPVSSSSFSSSSTSTTPSQPEVSVDEFIAHSCFSAIFYALLGGREASMQAFNHSDPSAREYYQFLKNYKVFIEYFNYLWLGLPLWLFPPAKTAVSKMSSLPIFKDIDTRPDLSMFIKETIGQMAEDGNSRDEIIGHVIEMVHVHINATKLAYWMLVNTLASQDAQKALLDEIEGLVSRSRAVGNFDASTSTVELSFEDIESLKSLQSILNESLRLTSGVLIVRGVVEDFVFTSASEQRYQLKKGDSIFFYPPMHHKDPAIFEEPEKFKWDRFIDTSFAKDGRPIDKPMAGFGSICVGQRFASFLAKWYLVRILYRWDMKLTTPVPPVDPTLQGHEILPPKKDCPARFTYTPRSNTFGVNLRMAYESSALACPRTDNDR